MDTTTTPPAAEDKTVAILSYLTLLGFIVAIILNSSKKNKLGIFHLRQTLGFYLTLIAVAICQVVLIVIPLLGLLVIFGLWCSILVLWIMGLVSAINGQMKPMPIVGPMYQRWFTNTFE
jgi:uncharacterized membrane protein